MYCTLERESLLRAAAGFRERKPAFKTGFVVDNRYFMGIIPDHHFMQ